MLLNNWCSHDAWCEALRSFVVVPGPTINEHILENRRLPLPFLPSPQEEASIAPDRSCAVEAGNHNSNDFNGPFPNTDKSSPGSDSASKGTSSLDGQGDQMDSSAIYMGQGRKPSVSFLPLAPAIASGSSVESAEAAGLGGKKAL